MRNPDVHKVKQVSVVIPCYCSESYLRSTAEGIFRAFQTHPDYSCQLILVNDGSSDQTFSVIRELCLASPRIIGIDLDRNYGQGAAKMSGIPYIRGEYAVFMDDDGQHDPAAIFSLLREIEKGNDLVYAQFPQNRESGWRRAASRLNDLLQRILTRKPRGLVLTSFFALSPWAVSFLKSRKQYAGSIGYTLFPYTEKITGVSVPHRERTEGTSHYTLRKLFAQWIRIIRGSRSVIPADQCGIREKLNANDTL